MLTALNGILIVVLLFWWGVLTGDVRLMSLAIISAAAAWVVNIAIDHSDRAPEQVTIWAGTIGVLVSVIAALTGIFHALSKGF